MESFQLNYYITNGNASDAPKYYVDGLGDNNGARPDAVDSLSFAVHDTLYLGGIDDFYYADSYNGGLPVLGTLTPMTW